jgi:tRNA uridine 5-carboxymethylaminomethyl modification enzyme
VPVSKLNLSNKAGEKILLADLLRRPDYDFRDLDLGMLVDEENREAQKLKARGINIEGLVYGYEVDTLIKYDGYIERQSSQIEEMQKFDRIKIPDDFDFKNCKVISLEARDKLAKVQPKTLGQAGRVGGVTPNDLSVLQILIVQNLKSSRFEP